MKKKNRVLRFVLAVLICCAVGLGLGYTAGTVYARGGFKIDLPFIGDNPVESKTNEAPRVDLQPVPEDQGDGYSTADIYEKVSPSVVNINVYAGSSVAPVSSGTGIIMTSDGYIITNAHVVSRGTSVNVIFQDGDRTRGTIVGSDEETDLAVIKVSENNLPAARFGDSDRIRIGEKAVAIGNAGGLSGTCTEGIISGLGRDMNSGARALSLIQTNAAINPGNSGGPLINRYAQVIGITSSKIANVDYEGIGFAIPISDALPIIQSLIENGYVTGRRVLGVSVIELNESNGPINGLPSKGIYIASINEGSDLAEKGVRERDVIVRVDGEDCLTTDDLMDILRAHAPGDVLELGIYRPETRQNFTVNVILIESK